MKLSLHPVILGESLDFEQLLALASELGYEGVDAGLDAAGRMGPDEFLQLCGKYNVYPSTGQWGWSGGKNEDTFRQGAGGSAGTGGAAPPSSTAPAPAPGSRRAWTAARRRR